MQRRNLLPWQNTEKWAKSQHLLYKFNTICPNYMCLSAASIEHKTNPGLNLPRDAFLLINLTFKET